MWLGDLDLAEAEEVGWDLGLAEDLLATCLHGRGQDGCLVEEHVDGYLQCLGWACHHMVFTRHRTIGDTIIHILKQLFKDIFFLEKIYL